MNHYVLHVTVALAPDVVIFVASKIKTHDSESRDQEEAGHTRRTSELFIYT